MYDISNLPEVQFGALANIFIKMMHFKKAGNAEKGHKHIYDHISMLAKGSVTIKVNGKESSFIAPALIFISKNDEHEITALEDDTLWACIHAVRKGDSSGDIVDESMIPAGVDAYRFMGELAMSGIIEPAGTCCGELSEEEREYIKDLEYREFIGSRKGSIRVGIPNR